MKLISLVSLNILGHMLRIHFVSLFGKSEDVVSLNVWVTKVSIISTLLFRSIFWHIFHQLIPHLCWCTVFPLWFDYICKPFGSLSFLIITPFIKQIFSYFVSLYFVFWKKYSSIFWEIEYHETCIRFLCTLFRNNQQLQILSLNY